MSVRRSFVWFGAVVIALGWASAPRRAGAQVATVAVKSAGDLLNEFRTLASQFDAANAQSVLQFVDTLEQGGQLKGIDLRKPIAVTLDLIAPAAAQAGQPFLPQFTGFLPITSQAEFLDLLKRFEIEADELPNAEGFSHRLTVAGGRVPPLFLLTAPPAGYAVVTNIPARPDALRAVKPAALRPARAGALFANLRLDRIPDMFKDLAIAKTKENNDASRAQRDKESDAEYRGRLFGMSLVEDGFTNLLREGRELALDLNVDPKTDRFSLNVKVDAKPGSPTAGTFTSFAARKSRFRAVGRGTALKMAGVVPIPAALRGLIQDQLKTLRDELQKEEEPDKRQMIELGLHALETSLSADALDAFMVLDVPVPDPDPNSKGGPNVVLSGFTLKDSKGTEALFRKAAATAKTSKGAGEIRLDHDRSRDGTAIHWVKPDPEKKATAEFGEPYGFVAFPEGALILAVGGNGLPVLKQALAAFANPGPSSKLESAQVAAEFVASQFALIYNATDPRPEPARQASRSAFAGKNANKDRLQISLRGENSGLLLSLEADLPILRFLAELGAGRKANPLPAP